MILSFALFANTGNIYFSSANAASSKKPSIQEQENYYDTQTNRGIAYLKQKQYDEAAKVFKEAQKISSKNPSAYINLAVVHIHKNELNAASRVLEWSESLFENDTHAKNILFYNLGLRSYKKGNHEKASGYYCRALTLNPKLIEAKRGLKMSKNKQVKLKKSKADQLMKKKTSQFKKNIETKNKNISNKEIKNNSKKISNNLLTKAYEAYKRNDEKSALKFINKNLSLNPENPIAHYRLGLI